MNELHPPGPPPPPPPPPPPSQGSVATPPPYRDPLATGGVPRIDLTVAAPSLVHDAVPTQATPLVPTNGSAPAPAVPPTPTPPPTPPPAAPAPVPDPAQAPTFEAARMDAIEVTSWFGSRKVLERCNLSMEPGRVTALIGPSGCGKSTFLRALNRMHELVPGAAIAGQILLNGVDIYSEEMSPTEVRLRVGMVFQKPNPFPAMSIAENVLAGLKLSGTSHPDHTELVEQSLRRAGLWEEVKDRLHEGGMSLSGGQQQRLCIARSLAVRPDVLLMDEPCSALDPISTGVIEETIRELCHDITIVIVTHNMQQAQRVSDECAFFLVESLGDSGRIVEHGPTGRMFSNPSDPRTLDYVSGRFG